MTNYIFGGTNVIAGTAHGFAQVGSISIGKGDINGLVTALQKVGVSEPDVAELQEALNYDAAEDDGKGPPTFGQRTAAWVKSLPAKLCDRRNHRLLAIRLRPKP